MEALPITIEKIAGAPGHDSYCAVTTKRLELGDGSYGMLAACLIVSNHDSKGQELVSGIFEKFTSELSQTQDSYLAVLETVQASITSEFREQDIDLALLFFWQNVCYLTRFGDKVKIFVLEKSKPLKIDFKSGSGPLKMGQIYLIATSAFLEFFDIDNFSDDKQINLEETVDGIATRLATVEDQSEIGAIFALAGRAQQTTGGDEQSAESVSSASSWENQEAALKPARRQFKLGSFFKKLLQTFALEFAKVRRGDIKALLKLRRNVVLLALLIILILSSSVGFAIYKQNKSQREAEFKAIYEESLSKYSEGTSIIELNRLRARELLIEASQKINVALSIDFKNKDAQKLLSDIEARLKETEAKSTVAFQSLTTTSSPIVDLEIYKGQILAFSDDLIYEVDLSSKQVSSFKTPTQVKASASAGDNLFVLTGSKVQKVNIGSETLDEVINTTGRDIAAFLSNIYLLGSQGISKYVPIENGWADFGDYLSEKVEFGANSKVAIDGLVWVVDGSKVYKFNRGLSENFAIQGLTSQNVNFKLIYTNVETEDLYLVDGVNSTLWVIGKDGIYKKSYQAEEFNKASAILVDIDKGKMYLAVDNQILEASL